MVKEDLLNCKLPGMTSIIFILKKYRQPGMLSQFPSVAHTKHQ